MPPLSCSFPGLTSGGACSSLPWSLGEEEQPELLEVDLEDFEESIQVKTPKEAKTWIPTASFNCLYLQEA